ncbi:hypothetical protein [Stieleria marina]|uniref:Uncharacterized protein n=1 Tax=Stieleria marina TaxID=1930275 RepID=A0A517NY46_9BACT|nr:hypothetical protein K239x_40440 [Planctomycetes bacterium K23_9]
MQRIANYSRILIATALVSVVAGTATADIRDFFRKVGTGYQRNNAWPDPFNEIDAMQVVAPFEAMKRNGWRLNNTLGNELFRGGDGALLASGNQKIHWIATQAPAHRREIFVLRGRSDEETQKRVTSVQQTLAGYTRNGATPPVMVTDRSPSSSSGAYATQINRMYLQDLPAPKLPSTSAAGTAAATQ